MPRVEKSPHPIMYQSHVASKPVPTLTCITTAMSVYYPLASMANPLLKIAQKISIIM